MLDARSDGLPDAVNIAAIAVVSVVILATAGAVPLGSFASTETSGLERPVASFAISRKGAVMPLTEMLYAPCALVVAVACAPVESIKVTLAPAHALPLATVPVTDVAVAVCILDEPDPDPEPPPQPLS
ncbi:hypothetical protein OH764_17495 [Burkholderia sp. M6-3]